MVPAAEHNDLSTGSDPAPHIPVLLRPILEAVAPVQGDWVDATFGAGGYSRGLLAAGADHVAGIDRDPLAAGIAKTLSDEAQGRFSFVQTPFSAMADALDVPQDGVVFDLGVSSMQLDQAERGFSFLQDGPLDMRMEQAGASAEDLVNGAPEGELADILYQYGEERASRRIARAIVAARAEAPITRTLQLAEIVSGCLPRPKPGQSHPATRSFQALRIAVNDEFGEIVAGLEAAEALLRPGGWLAVVTFHSLEDRIVKRFLQARSGTSGRGNRYAPEIKETPAAFHLERRRSIAADESELAANPRARSARLRLARRSDAPAGRAPRDGLGLPRLTQEMLR
ncbi:MAG: 16S rRNA (cytosine(1402)-N(4))-methyltransferase RsmH [Mangrovicoccus sp.]|nr:16S rRNA (cytosine(1402)-N(4))-methyltransferase RsmH [Mangrovicoccus sp.]